VDDPSVTWSFDLVSKLLSDYVKNYLIDIVSVCLCCCNKNYLMDIVSLLVMSVSYSISCLKTFHLHQELL